MMDLLVLGKDKNVVKVGDAGMVNVLLHNMVDKALELGWCIA